MYLIIGSKEDPVANGIINNLINELKLSNFKRVEEINEITEKHNSEEHKNEINKNNKKDINVLYIHKTLPLHIKEIEGNLIFGPEVDKGKKYSYVIFLSKHESKLQNKTFCVHSPGNFGEPFGGEKRKLCRSAPWLFKSLMKELANLCTYTENELGIPKLNYEIWNEPTHHGPYCNTPCVFLEIGATKEAWNDKNAAIAAAIAIINVITLNSSTNNHYKNAIYLGGLHYSDKAKKIILESEYAIGHICPKYSFELLDSGMLNQMISNTGDIKKIFVEKKSFVSGGKKKELFILLEKTGIAIEKV